MLRRRHKGRRRDCLAHGAVLGGAARSCKEAVDGSTVRLGPAGPARTRGPGSDWRRPQRGGMWQVLLRLRFVVVYGSPRGVQVTL
ncbi:hypothetical protein NDU88_006794 [Pleurodeles waltl]|uniref:Uncharacterized protein n=1 Tax=Pleurodeles waltl TaxID=8319 RepID=A0AAV7TZJ9_PLEWA|nr:hypothetical protein NDU88_006794 [Pleurodeles waltl]